MYILKLKKETTMDNITNSNIVIDILIYNVNNSKRGFDLSVYYLLYKYLNNYGHLRSSRTKHQQNTETFCKTRPISIHFIRLFLYVACT